MTLLTVENLSVSFQGEHADTAAVTNVSFSIEKGEIYALVGESGSGKSVTALSILQLLPYPAAFHPSGTITFNGEKLLDPTITPHTSTLAHIRGNRISMIFQEPQSALNPLHTIGRQIAESITIHQPLSQKQAIERTKELLELVGLSNFTDRLVNYPHQLSGGERQRVMIAMAIANNPDLLIADEPTTALDVTIQAQILELLDRLRREMGMAVLLITHDLTIVRRVSDRVAVMRRGALVETGPTKDIFAKPQHEYTKQLLASEPKGTPLPLTGNPATLISCEDLKVHFPRAKNWLGKATDWVKAVDGVSLSIPQGSTLGIVGESGSGKTTLALALLRLIRSSGRVVFMGNRIDTLNTTQIRPLRKEMQVVFQDPYASLNPRMPVGEIITEGLTIHFPSYSPSTIHDRLDAILEEVGLSPDMKNRYPHEFSGGQRQRISIARAMILKPRLVVLDEPTSALDLSVQAQIMALLRELQEKHGVTFIFISHDLRVIRAISHRVVVMRKGKIVEEGASAELFSAPREDYTKALIRAALL